MEDLEGWLKENRIARTNMETLRKGVIVRSSVIVVSNHGKWEIEQ